MGCLSKKVVGRTYYRTWASVRESGGESRRVVVRSVLNAVREQGQVHRHFNLIHRNGRVKWGYSFCRWYSDLLSVFRLNYMALFCLTLSCYQSNLVQCMYFVRLCPTRGQCGLPVSTRPASRCRGLLLFLSLMTSWHNSLVVTRP